MTVQAIQHADVKGKIQHYIKISNGENNVLINVGQKTYDSVKAIEKVVQLPLEEEKKQKHGTPNIPSKNN